MYIYANIYIYNPMSILNLYKYIHIYVYIYIYNLMRILNFFIYVGLFFYTFIDILLDFFFSPRNLNPVSDVFWKKKSESTVFLADISEREASGQNWQLLNGMWFLHCSLQRYSSLDPNKRGVWYQILPRLQPQWKEFNSWLISQNPPTHLSIL